MPCESSAASSEALSARPPYRRGGVVSAFHLRVSERMKNSSVVFPSARKRLVAPVYDERANVLEIEITFQLRRLEPIAIDSGCPLLSGREDMYFLNS